MASYAEVLGHISVDRANELTMKPPFPPRDPDHSNASGNHTPLGGAGNGAGAGAAMARSKDHSIEPTLEALGPEEGLRVLSESWREDPVIAGGPEGADQNDGGEYHDLRSYIWTQLVARLQNGEPKAMEELYGMFSNGVRYYLCRQLGPEELEDRLHDAFLVVVDSIRAGELRDPRRLMGFIRTVVKRMVATAIDKQIAARRERIDDEKTSNVSDKRVTPEGALLFRQQTEIVREVLNEMSERDRQILSRFYVEEQSPQRICEDMNLTMTQFRLLKSRAKNRFGELGKKKVQKSGLSQIFLRFSGS
jgi:RNA polymerase sigma factor (sigma-70 family)